MRLTVKGQVTIPKAIRKRFGFHPGSEIRFVEEDRRVVLRKAGDGDVWEKYRGFAKRRARSGDLFRRLRGRDLKP